MEPWYIKNLGHWKSDSQYELYLAKMHTKIMKLMTEASENYKVHNNPRDVPKLPEELQRLIFPFIEQCNISLNALDASDPSPAAYVLLDFMDRVRTVMLQDVAQLINIGRTHILFDNEVFKTELFLNYNEALSTFCRIIVNLLSQSLNVVMP